MRFVQLTVISIILWGCSANRYNETVELASKLAANDTDTLECDNLTLRVLRDSIIWDGTKDTTTSDGTFTAKLGHYNQYEIYHYKTGQLAALRSGEIKIEMGINPRLEEYTSISSVVVDSISSRHFDANRNEITDKDFFILVKECTRLYWGLLK